MVDPMDEDDAVPKDNIDDAEPTDAIAQLEYYYQQLFNQSYRQALFYRAVLQAIRRERVEARAAHDEVAELEHWYHLDDGRERPPDSDESHS